VEKNIELPNVKVGGTQFPLLFRKLKCTEYWH